MTSSLDERLAEATVGALELFGVYLGTRLDLYRTLHDGGPQRVDEFAKAAQVDPRYAREWLEQQAVAGMIEVDDPTRPADERRYQLPAEHVAALLDEQHAAHVAPFAEMIVGVAQTLDDVAVAYRDGTGVPYERYGATPSPRAGRHQPAGVQLRPHRDVATGDPGRARCLGARPKRRSPTSGAAWAGQRSRSPGPTRKRMSSASTVMPPRSARPSSMPSTRASTPNSSSPTRLVFPASVDSMRSCCSSACTTWRARATHLRPAEPR